VGQFDCGVGKNVALKVQKLDCTCSYQTGGYSIKCTMALARCKDHPPHNTRAKSPYIASVAPLKPCVAVLCGRGKCTNEAFLWLTASEKAQYEQGIRIFEVNTHCVKIRVADKLEPKSVTDPTRRTG
jgi:hypothetical protein